MDLYFIIFIIAILSYYYLFNEINKNNYLIIIVYFIFLAIGYYYIGLKIYLYNSIIIIYNVLKNNKEGFKEGNQADMDIITEEAEKMASTVQQVLERSGGGNNDCSETDLNKFVAGCDKCF